MDAPVAIRVVSCGVLLVNPLDEVFLAHATGTSHWDVPKGECDLGESPLHAALREAREEAGIDLGRLALADLGLLDYRRDKALHLYAAKITKASLNVAACVCVSHFRDERTGRDVPEMDAYSWVHKSDIARFCGTNMRRVLGELLAGGLVERLPLQFL